MKDPLDMRCSAILVLSAIDGLGKYLAVTEAQMEEVLHIERHTHETQASRYNREEREEDQSMLNDLDNLYETELYPAMRYSFVVLLHIFTETRLRKFCSELQDERHVPIGVTDLSGSAIERIRTFLTKLAGVSVKDFPEKEWESLQNLQKIRDCIVHAYGHVKDSRDGPWLRKFASSKNAVSIGDDGRLQIELEFCQQQLDNLRRLFESLFQTLGWA